MVLLAGAAPLLATGAAGWDGASFSSVLPALDIVSFSELPGPPEGVKADDYCSHLTVTPASAAGKRVAKAGWAVTGEVTVEGLTMVSFVAGMEAGTSGSCLLSDGNIGFFLGEKLLAVAYAPESGASSIGLVELLGDDILRIFDGDYLPRPIGDISLKADQAVELVPLPETDTYCDGAAVVPLIYDLPIGEARQSLAAHGWEPDTTEASEPLDSRSAELAENGLPEVTSCSGTGFGFCNFEYASAAAGLSVITVGEASMPDTPAIADYVVSCTAGKAE